MKRLCMVVLTLLMCWTACDVNAWNPALNDNNRWEYFDTNKEYHLEYDKKSVTFDGRYIYVWVKRESANPSLMAKTSLQLLCIDTDKKKSNVLDTISYSNGRVTGSSARYNTYKTKYCIPTDKKYIEEKVNKYLIDTLYSKKEKLLLVEEDQQISVVLNNHREKWSYLSNLSTNIWRYIGGRDLSHGESVINNDEFVFYYDKQTLKVSDDGRYVSVWLKYRFVEEVGGIDAPKKVKYGLTRTTIDLQDGTYSDHVALSFNENGTLEKNYTSNLNVANPILSGTIMDIIWKGLLQDLSSY